MYHGAPARKRKRWKCQTQNFERGRSDRAITMPFALSYASSQRGSRHPVAFGWPCLGEPEDLRDTRYQNSRAARPAGSTEVGTWGARDHPASAPVGRGLWDDTDDYRRLLPTCHQRRTAIHHRGTGGRRRRARAIMYAAFVRPPEGGSGSRQLTEPGTDSPPKSKFRRSRQRDASIDTSSMVVSYPQQRC